MKDKNEVCVVGLGYIGLPTAAMFSSRGKKVIGVDINKETVEIINKGKIHIVEPGLEKIVKKSVSDGLLRASTEAESADAFLIAVPTPFKPLKTKSFVPEPDLSYIESACELISRVLKKGDLVILESTSPVGTTEKISVWLSELRPDLKFPHEHNNLSNIKIAHCPERVLPGNIIKELVDNDRLIGGITDKCSIAATSLYKIFVEGECITTNARTAEMAKLTENASRDVNIAFANELSLICDDLNIDVWELIKLANRHPRVNILEPGPGVGGHCIAVDPWFIVSRSQNDAKLIHSARIVNDGKPDWVIDKIRNKIDSSASDILNKAKKNISISLFGISFKPNIDDLRESPAMYIAEKLLNFYPDSISIVEPNIKSLPNSLNGCNLISASSALSDTDLIVILVDHDEFYALDFKDKAVIDFKGILSK